MINYVINRPIAVLSILVSCILTGLFLLHKIPVSLLPDISIPKLTIQFSNLEMDGRTIEDQLIKPIRANIVNLEQLQDIQSTCGNAWGKMTLEYNQSANIDLAEIELNERIDRILPSLPIKNRPIITRANISDIPIVRIQIVPRSTHMLAEVSELTEKLLKRRIEQIPGVSIVNIKGRQTTYIEIKPDIALCNSLHINTKDIEKALLEANASLPSLQLNDGIYSYQLSVPPTLQAIEDIEEIPISAPNGIAIKLKEAAEVITRQAQYEGFHLYNGKAGLVILVQKRPDSRMKDVMESIERTIHQFRKDFPHIDFEMTQNQEYLLNAAIDNLDQDIILGTILTITLLFLLLGNWQSPFLMSINIPLSLILTFIAFYLLDISFNIVSLSGLALGIGMLIDNSIVVIDHIHRQHTNGLDTHTSCVKGVNQVAAPVISQVLTTVAVYAPLILLSGTGATLINDQSIALTISLSVSLVIAFIVTPVIYKLMLKRRTKPLRSDTNIYRWIEKRYHQMINFILDHRRICFILTIALMPVGALLLWFAKKETMPKLRLQNGEVDIFWNEQISVDENMTRIQTLYASLKPLLSDLEADNTNKYSFTSSGADQNYAHVLFTCASYSQKEKLQTLATKILKQQYPRANFSIKDAPNAFTEVFVHNEPYMEARFRSYKKLSMNDPSFIELSKQLSANVPKLEMQTNVNKRSYQFSVNRETIARYGIEQQQIVEFIKESSGIFNVARLTHQDEQKDIYINTGSNADFNELLNKNFLSDNGTSHPLRTLLAVNLVESQEKYTSDAEGAYLSAELTEQADVEKCMKSIQQIAGKFGYRVTFAGSYLRTQRQSHEMLLIFFVVLFLLYVILAVQFENLFLPLLIMLTIPLGVTGSMTLLSITGASLNIMTGIGFIVVLGLIVDDPILKVETLQRLVGRNSTEKILTEEYLRNIVHEAGSICLKPLLMVSLTTSIALVPVLIFGGIGNDLQKPMAVVIIGGLSIGTFFTSWFIPLAYYYYIKRANIK